MFDGWETTTLGELAQWSQGKFVPKSMRDPAGLIPIMGANGVIGRTNTALFDQPVITVGRVGACGEVHRTDSPVWVSDNAFVVQPISCTFDFLFLALQNMNFEPIISGSSQPLVNQTAVKALTINLPPPNEQRRIVDLIGVLDTAIGAAEAQTQALIGALSQARESWIWKPEERVPLGDICEVDGSLVDPTAAENKGLPHVGTERIVGGTGDLTGVRTAAEDGVTSGKFRFSDAHVIYSKIRPNLQKVAVPYYSGLCSADAYPLRPLEGRSRVFLQQMLLSATFTEAATARSGRTKMPKINKSELMSILVPRHSIAGETELASLLLAMDDARSSSAVRVRALVELRANLLSALLSGAHRIPGTYDELMGV